MPAIGNAQAARAMLAPSTGDVGPYRSRVKNRMLARRSSARCFSQASSMVIALLVYRSAFYGGGGADLLDVSAAHRCRKYIVDAGYYLLFAAARILPRPAAGSSCGKRACGQARSGTDEAAA